MKHNHSKRSFAVITESRGFTLVELMITMVISGIVVAAIYSAYMAQQRVYLAQDQVAEMQQNIRASMWMINSEIRMAGHGKGDGTNDTSCNVGATGASVAPGVLTVTPGQVDFSMDLNSDGDCADTGENLSYYIFNSGGVQKLLRWDNNNPPLAGDEDEVAIADNIDQIEFNYLDASGGPATQPDDIRSIEISILARAGQPDRKFTNSMTYTTASNTDWGSYNDNFRRRLLITTVSCRNMGL